MTIPIGRNFKENVNGNVKENVKENVNGNVAELL
jgi:hypothetical protein